jgi:hypothetical protein
MGVRLEQEQLAQNLGNRIRTDPAQIIEGVLGEGDCRQDSSSLAATSDCCWLKAR